MFTDRYGFIAWNLFQIKHFGPLMNYVGNPIILCPKERATASFKGHIETIESAFGAKVLVLKERDIKGLDGLLRGIFSQTNFASSSYFSRTPLFALQYSMAKEEHQYGPWHLNFNAAFCYGDYSATKTSYFCPSFPVGHPRLSVPVDQATLQSHAALLQQQLDPKKPTLLYAPTWGKGGSIEIFQAAIEWIREHYNVLVRPHHNSRVREEDRLQALAPIFENPVEDDFPIQASISDLIVSDFSGVIFDALLLGKPVLLLRNEEVVKQHLQNISPDSIEVARAAEIGPVASDSRSLQAHLSEGIDRIVEEYRERNTKLIDECFVRESNVPERILAIAERFAHSEYPELPQRLWLRKYIRRKRTETRHVAKAVSSSSVGPVRRLRRHLSSNLKRSRRFYKYYLKYVAPLRGRRYRSHAITLLINIGEPEAAATLLKSEVVSTQIVTDLFYRLWTKAPGNQLDLDKAHEFERTFSSLTLEPTARLRRAVVNNDRQAIANMVSWAATEISSGDRQRMMAALASLKTLRQIRLLMTLVKENPSLLELPKILQLIHQADDIQQRLGSLSDWADEASAFDASAAPAVCSTDTIDVFIPTHFYAAWDPARMERRIKNWNLVRHIYHSLFNALSEEESLSVQPRHQYFLNLVPTAKSRMSLSFFTKGGSKFNWHIKDVGIGSYISIDPDGYLSSSIFAKAEPADLAQRISSIPPNEEIFDRWRKLFDQHGGDKYAQTRESPDYSPGDVDFFVPLQSTRGLEETSQPIEELIRTITNYARQTGAKVVFKRHPLCDDVLIDLVLSEAKHLPSVSVSSADTWSLVQACSTLITVNSGVALQGIVAEKSVVVLGPSEVNCVAIQLRDHRELKRIIDRLHGHSPDRDLYAKFLTVFLNGYLVNADDPHAVKHRIADANSVAQRSTSVKEARDMYLDYLIDKVSNAALQASQTLRTR